MICKYFSREATADFACDVILRPVVKLSSLDEISSRRKTLQSMTDNRLQVPSNHSQENSNPGYSLGVSDVTQLSLEMNILSEGIILFNRRASQGWFVSQ